MILKRVSSCSLSASPLDSLNSDQILAQSPSYFFGSLGWSNSLIRFPYRLPEVLRFPTRPPGPI